MCVESVNCINRWKCVFNFKCNITVSARPRFRSCSHFWSCWCQFGLFMCSHSHRWPSFVHVSPFCVGTHMQSLTRHFTWKEKSVSSQLRWVVSGQNTLQYCGLQIRTRISKSWPTGWPTRWHHKNPQRNTSMSLCVPSSTCTGFVILAQSS